MHGEKWRKVAVATAAVIMTASLAQAQTAALTVNQDGAHRSSGIHWPAGHAPEQADLFAHNELVIDAGCPAVWQHIVGAGKWPDWYPNARNVHIENNKTGVLRAGSRFTWNTFGLPIASTVHEFVPNSRAGWFGTSKDLDAYHTWLLLPAKRGCHVITEEVVKGKAAIALRESDPDAMHKGHDLWLATLKKVSEKK